VVTGCPPGSDGAAVPGYPPEIARDLIAEIRTDLDAFSEGERFVLENHGYLLAEAAIRRHANFLANRPMPPPRAPHCEWMEAGRVRSALAESAEQRLPFGRF
jgi:NTE family protein